MSQLTAVPIGRREHSRFPARRGDPPEPGARATCRKNDGAVVTPGRAAAPLPVSTRHTFSAGPPAIATFFKVVLSKKPTHWPRREEDGLRVAEARQLRGLESFERTDEKLRAAIPAVDDARAVWRDRQIARVSRHRKAVHTARRRDRPPSNRDGIGGIWSPAKSCHT